MAAALGMSAASLQNRIYEVKGRVLHTEHALAMQTLSGRTDFAEAIARITGGMFVQLPSLEDECDNKELLTKFTLILDQLGALARTHAQAIADGVVDDQEKAEPSASRTTRIGTSKSCCSSPSASTDPTNRPNR